MRLPTILGAAALASLSLLTSPTAATALTYKLAPNEKQCFYSTADKKGSKVAFYFAVCFFSHGPQMFFSSVLNVWNRFNRVAPLMSIIK